MQPSKSASCGACQKRTQEDKTNRFVGATHTSGFKATPFLLFALASMVGDEKCGESSNDFCGDEDEDDLKLEVTEDIWQIGRVINDRGR